jgi:aminobenzoyl-glutamate utilization protein B
MHYTVLDGGDVPNVIPEHARLWCWLRDSKKTGVEALLERARNIAKGAALAAGVEAELRVQGGSYEMLVNMAGARRIHRNLEWLGPIPFGEADDAFARELQQATGVEVTGLRATVEPFDDSPGEPEGGSTDMADVSWVVPTLHLSVTTAPAKTPWHAWPVVACAGTSIGHKGMMHAAKALAATAVDMFEDGAFLAEVRDEFAKSTRGHDYRGFVPDGPPPIPSD